MSEKYVVGDLTDFPVGSHKVIEVKNRSIGIFNVNGELHALPNLCPHQVGPLCQGKVSGTLTANEATHWRLNWTDEGQIITCPWHGMEYRIQTGQCLAYPSIKLRTYSVVVEQEKVNLVL